MKVQFLVTVDMPKTIGINVMAWYIRDAVRTWKGCMDPEGELFNMNGNKFTVKYVKEGLHGIKKEK